MISLPGNKSALAQCVFDVGKNNNNSTVWTDNLIDGERVNVASRRFR